jgi:photosystem II stability/assembly factor-like uncharacterized protein/LmbE family N-acetylglucosaminyl deacetylase
MYVWFRFVVLLLLTSLTAVAASNISAAPPAGPSTAPPALLDAQLEDITFVDADHGWAVGQRGAIWHTRDGGATWVWQPSGVACALRSVCFVDSQTGWAAGGEWRPYLHDSQGVLLRTRDGGATWERDRALALPSIQRVGFFSTTAGWASTMPSPLFGAGLFLTEDGGRSWSSIAPGGQDALVAADFRDPARGAVSSRGAVFAVRRRGVESSSAPSFDRRAPRAIRFEPGGRGWLVGDQGLVLTTTDGGQSWRRPPSAPPAALADSDWAAVAVRGTHCWIVGEPGRRVLSSADGGRSWREFATPVDVPWRGVCFLDERRGWLAGALGTIAATRDGGATWSVQQRGGSRLALLGLFGQPEDVPLELFARTSAVEGYLSAVELLHETDFEASSHVSDDRGQRIEEALARLGANSAVVSGRFPVRSRALRLSGETVAAAWGKGDHREGVEAMRRALVRKLRMWRPDVVVTHAADPSGRDPRAHLLNQLVLQAARDASDAGQFPDQLLPLGLSTWKPRKVFGVVPRGELGTVNISAAQAPPRLGTTLAEYTASARALVFDPHEVPPTTLGLHLYINDLPQASGGQEVFSGLTHHPASEARRALPPAHGEQAEALRRLASRERNVQAVLTWSGSGRLDRGQILARIEELIAELDDDSAGKTLFRLGMSYHRRGRADLAAETLEILLHRQPGHPLVRPALAWLIQYHASSETAWRERREVVPMPLAPVTTNLPTEALSQVLPAALGPTLESGVARAAGAGGSRDEDPRAARVRRLVELVGAGGALDAEPRVLLPLGAIARARGEVEPARRGYEAVARQLGQGAWAECAAGELWRLAPDDSPPRPVFRASRTATRPLLDGQLDEEMWRHAAPIEMRSLLRDDRDWPAVGWVAYDAEFLYLGGRCRRAVGAEYAASSGPRPRDAELDGHDRVEFHFDLDGDFVTFYTLSVDHRGWTGESCWRDASWNPTWYVAAGGDADEWRVEAAIPLAELGPTLPTSAACWVFGCQRIVPGVGFQSATRPAAPRAVGQGLGYLQFE